MKKTFTQNFCLLIFAIFQLFVAGVVCVGIWPAWVVYANLVLQIVVLFLFDAEYALYSVAVSVPFYLAIPAARFDTLSTWRIVFAALFARFAWERRANIFSVKFSRWDKYLLGYALVILLSLLIAHFKFVGFKKLLFMLNVYMLYVVVLNTVRTKAQAVRALWATLASFASILIIGYIQFGITLYANTYYFWQYWAAVISKAYYGLELSTTLTYSNSWFSFYPNQPPSLRMFSILPDSHAFALIMVLSLPFATALLYFAETKIQRVGLWVYIVLASLAITLSGTRGVWVAVLAPLAILVVLYFKKMGTKVLMRTYWPILLILFFLVASPFAQKVAEILHARNNYGNFIERASSVYDLSEESNAGRLHIWKDTLVADVHHPLLGVGYGNFITTLSPQDTGAAAAAGASYAQLATAKDAVYNLPSQYITAHNFYLDVFTETGLLGLLFFVLFAWGTVAGCWKFFRAHTLYYEDGLVHFVAAAGLALVWLFAYSLFDGTLINDRVLTYFFVLLALVGAVLRIYPEGNA
jgi:putative inorganic carbon (HCO3(-)) transporter